MRRARFAAVSAALLIATALAGPGRAEKAASEFVPESVAPSGWRIIEGDILIRESDLEGPIPHMMGTFQADRLWPGGVVPFAFDTSVTNTPSRLMQAQAAMAKLASLGGAGNVTFVPRTNQADFIRYVADTAFNFSPVGRQGGMQEIHVVSWSNVQVIEHETMHSLGFYHEQSRTDRDTYVTVHLENVCQTCCSGGSCNHNFVLQSGSSDYGPYDFDSVMHYDQCAFLSPSLFCAAPNFVITVNPPWTAQWQDAIGQRDHLSKLDSLSVAFLYAPGNWRFVDLNGDFEFADGSFLNPWPQFATGATFTPGGGRLLVQPGSYLVYSGSTFSTPMRIDAPLGGVQITGISVAANAKGP